MSEYIFNFSGDDHRLREALERIEKNQIIIMASQQDLVLKLNKVTAQLQKVAQESSVTLQKVKELQAMLDDEADVSAELQAAVDALVAQVQLVDDLVPDVISNGSSGGISNGSSVEQPVNDPNASGPGDSGNATGNAGKFGVS